MRSETLLRAHAVDGQLQGASAIRRPSQLVINQPERSILEKIEPIGLPFQRDRPRAIARRDRELAFETVLEQAFDDRDGTLGFHAEHGLAQTSRG